jgi:hypothetical protein
MVAPGNLARLYRRIVRRGQWRAINADLISGPQAEISPFKTLVARLDGGLFYAHHGVDTPPT